MAPKVMPADDEGYFLRPFETDQPKTRQPIRLARLHMSAHENAPGDRFHIRLTLSCDSDSIIGADAQYEIRLRQCHVRLDTLGAAVDDSTAYTFNLPKGDWSQTASDAETGESGRSAGLDGQVSVGARLGALTAKLGAVVAGKTGRQRRNRQETQSAREFDLIGYGSRGWYVGHAVLGDPRHDGYLRSKYFNEETDRFLCAVDLAPTAEVSHVVARVQCTIGQLRVDKLDRLGRASGEAGEEYAEDIDRAMRERLRGIVVGKALHRQQRDRYPHLPENAYLLAECSLEAHRPGRSRDGGGGPEKAASPVRRARSRKRLPA